MKVGIENFNEENAMDVDTNREAAFQSCKPLRQINFAERDTRLDLDGFAFSLCESLTTLDLPEGVIELPCFLLYYSLNLKKIFIPRSVKEIHKACPFIENLTVVGYAGTTAEKGYKFEFA